MRPGFLVLGAVLVACHAKSSEPTDAAASASAGVIAADAPLDPAVRALLKPVESCTIKDDFFQDCAAAKTFEKRDAAAFEGEKGDALLLALLTSPDEHDRIVATSRSMHDAPRLLSSKVNAERLLGQLEREKNRGVRDALVESAGQIDVEKLGLRVRLEAIAASEDGAVRKAIARWLLARTGPTARVGIVAKLLDDPRDDVREAAANALSVSTMSGRDDASSACAPLARALDGAHAGSAVGFAAGAKRCPGIQEKALTYVEAKTSNLAAVTNHTGINYSLAVGALCDSTQGDAGLKKRAYEVAARLASAADPDPSTRQGAIGHLAQCDPARAKTALEKLTTDKDTSVAAEAKSNLAKLTAASK